MACIWYGVQTWIGGNCVVLMIRANGPSFYHLRNTMEGSSTDTSDFVSFFIFWAGSLPAFWYVVALNLLVDARRKAQPSMTTLLEFFLQLAHDLTTS